MIENSLTAWNRYCADAAWRWVATMDVLRERAANMQAHEAAGMPPLLHFEAEQVADARELNPPCNYRLLRVTRCGTDHLEEHVRADEVPVLVVDPRAGHGPGIGGFRRDSEVGMALLEGHPVYFVVFDPEPVEGQTLGAVIGALARFVEIVARRHQGRAPIVYGNCQGGWAVTLALSHCRREAGLIVLNGSPLSYWAGESGVNPMRLLGGFTGGVWPAHWLADLGAGRFDGAWLVQNFEALRPEGVWKKYDDLQEDPAKERERFLEFERWWNGYYFLGRDEILSIVRDLFIGNRVQKGEVIVDRGCRADLTRIRAPLVIFSSHGDNITPPHQALGWLRAVYPSTEALKAAGQRIVFLLHEKVGHLGIFVSTDVARREHRAILHHVAAMQALSPGLYEMRLEAENNPVRASAARFIERQVEDLPFDFQPRGFDRVEAVSQQLDALYSFWMSPWVRALATPASARMLESLHPMRSSRMFWSDRLNPVFAFLPLIREALEEVGARDEGRQSNPWYRAERALADTVKQTLKDWRVMRDSATEITFASLYGF